MSETFALLRRHCTIGSRHAMVQVAGEMPANGVLDGLCMKIYIFIWAHPATPCHGSPFSHFAQRRPPKNPTVVDLSTQA